MAQLENLEAKMASIEVSLSTPRRKKSSSVSEVITSPKMLRNRDYHKELNSLRIALRDKENIIKTLKDQLCNTLNNRLALHNATPPITEMDKQAMEERFQRLRQDVDNKRLIIKNLKLTLERLDITDNIDVRIQQAELEYRLGREELELLTLREETKNLKTALELSKTNEKQKDQTVFSCITEPSQITIHAVEVSADPKSPQFGVEAREDAVGLYINWAIENTGLCKGDRILEVNGKLVMGMGQTDLTRLLAVVPDAAQIVVLRKNISMTTLRTLRSDNLRLTHRISYLEEQIHDLLATKTKIIADNVTNFYSSKQGFFQDIQSRTSEHSEPLMTGYKSSKHSVNTKPRPVPPKKPLRLSLYRTTSLQSVESAPPTISISSTNHKKFHVPIKKPSKRIYLEDLSLACTKYNLRTDADILIPQQEILQYPHRTDSRTESCQRALKWPSIKSGPNFPQLSVEKWC